MKQYIAVLFIITWSFSFGQETNTMIVDWGDNTFGQLRPSFKDVRAVKVSAGFEHSMAILKNGSVIAWGDNTFDQLDVPAGIVNPIKVEAGLGQSLVLQADGRVIGWGFNDFGQTEVSLLNDVVDIAAGDEHSVVLFEDGTVQVITMGSTYDLTPPVGLTNVIAIASGNFHIVALRSDGTVVSWGANEFGQSTVPAGVSDVVSIDAGQFHSVALKSDGTIVGWGDNSLFGQLEIPSGSDFSSIQVGDFHSLALTEESDLSIWGSNRFTERLIPDVLEGRTIVETSYSAGFAHNTLVASNIGPTAIIINDTIEAEENIPVETIIETMETTDPDAVDDHVYQLVPGPGDEDNDSFGIFMLNLKNLITDDLTWGNLFNLDGIVNRINLDYESDSLYSIRVQSTDLGGLSIEKVVIVKVADINEEVLAIDLDNKTILEASPIGTLVGNFTTTDIDLFDSHTYSLVAGNGDDDNNAFSISGDELLINELADHSVKNTYTIRVRSTDSGGFFVEEPFVIRVIPINEQPTDILLSNNSIEEGEPPGTLVGFFSTTDPNSEDIHTYTLVEGEGDDSNSLFSIESDALLSDAVYDFSVSSSYSIRVRSTDNGLPENAFMEEIFVINILQLNETPILNDQTFAIKETAEAGDLVGTIIASDDGVTTISIISGNESGVFNLEENTGQLFVANSSLLDALSNPIYELQVRVTDEFGLFAEAIVTVNVEFVGQPPVVQDQFFEIDEDIAVQELVGTIQAFSPRGTELVFALMSGNENGIFSIEDDGSLFVADNSTIDSRRTPQYVLRVSATDLERNLTDEGTVLVTVADVNLAPQDILLDNNIVDEQSPINTRVGLLSTVDPDLGDFHSYSLIAGEGDEDNTSFTIRNNELLTSEIFDFRSRTSYRIRVRSEDNGIPSASTEKEFVVSVRKLDLPIVPTAFTPNGDGTHDTWHIPELDTFESSIVEVFDHTGRRVFFSRGYDRPWDGSFNGRILPVASYYYLISLNDLAGTKLKGLISILR